LPDIDPARVRLLFERAGPARADFILREIATRMFERLDYIRVTPNLVLDAGCGGGADLIALRARYAGARVVGVDLGLPSGQRLRPGWLARWLGRGTPAAELIQADLGALPVAAGSLDLLWSNLALHWHPAPHAVFPEWRRALRVDGLLLFSTFGPDTLQEVRAAFAAADPAAAPTAHVAAFTDMHDYGDMLVESGFATPVMDVERLTLTYQTADALWADVRALGGNAATTRRRGLMGKAARDRLDEALAATCDADGRYRLTFEIIYGHAWKGQPRTTAAGEAIVRLERRPRG